MDNQSSKYCGNPLGQSQQAQPFQQHQLSNEERHMALASIFNSLTSLANTNHQQQQNQQAHFQAPQAHPQASSIDSSMAITNSIQSVVTAAMIQQQLAASAAAVSSVSSSQQLPTSSMSADPATNSILANQLVSSELNQTRLPIQQLQQQQAQHQQTQRINYCTICNKELCNKYFMKTHMLKMHGINLEMEQPDEETDQELETDNGSEIGHRKSDEQSVESSSDAADGQVWLNNTGDRSDVKKSNNQASPPNKTANNQNKKKQSSNSATSKATSVLNGFAGNSMGGVVCDVCNKELCSKYFLKVHKQNTHGIVTDYQDASQFMYPIGVPMTAPNLFMNPSPLNPNLTNPSTFPANQLSSFMSQHQSQPEEVVKKSKRPRLSQSKQTLSSTSSFDIDKSNDASANKDNGFSKQFETVYRLMLTQQQQQQQQQQHTMSTGPSSVATPIMTFDPITSNPLSTLMCIGAMGPQGPFGPTAMSPAMIVDNILRNQHLLNRNSSVSGGTVNKTMTNKDGNNNESTKPNSNKNSKDASGNSRYFSHYTEACPMCDRRFKSIKWLKTHMMNDHKQEIGAYMQMMMQYLYTSKTQQMAAAATMAALEQQKQQQQQQQQSLIQHAKSHSQQFYQSNSIFPSSSFQYQPNLMVDPSGQIDMSRPQYIDQNHGVESKSSPPGRGSDFVIRARYRHESISPNEIMNRQSPSSPTSKLQLNNYNQDNHSSLGLNFELDKLTDRKVENFLISQVSHDSSDLIDESSRESEVRVKDETEVASSSKNRSQQYQINSTSTS